MSDDLVEAEIHREIFGSQDRAQISGYVQLIASYIKQSRCFTIKIITTISSDYQYDYYNTKGSKKMIVKVRTL
jgi:hypothetical protein